MAQDCPGLSLFSPYALSKSDIFLYFKFLILYIYYPLYKLLEKLFLNKLKPIIARDNLIPSHQFGFREHHSTVDQIHRITHN